MRLPVQTDTHTYTTHTTHARKKKNDEINHYCMRSPVRTGTVLFSTTTLLLVATWAILRATGENYMSVIGGDVSPLLPLLSGRFVTHLGGSHVIGLASAKSVLLSLRVHRDEDDLRRTNCAIHIS